MVLRNFSEWQFILDQLIFILLLSFNDWRQNACLWCLEYDDICLYIDCTLYEQEDEFMDEWGIVSSRSEWRARNIRKSRNSFFDFSHRSLLSFSIYVDSLLERSENIWIEQVIHNDRANTVTLSFGYADRKSVQRNIEELRRHLHYTFGNSRLVFHHNIRNVSPSVLLTRIKIWRLFLKC